MNEKPEEWERFYNLHRPHTAFGGKTPYEALKEELKGNEQKSAKQESSIEAAPAVKTLAQPNSPSDADSVRSGAIEDA